VNVLVYSAGCWQAIETREPQWSSVVVGVPTDRGRGCGEFLFVCKCSDRLLLTYHTVRRRPATTPRFPRRASTCTARLPAFCPSLAPSRRFLLLQVHPRTKHGHGQRTIEESIASRLHPRNAHWAHASVVRKPDEEQRRYSQLRAIGVYIQGRAAAAACK
jgi:hypothetical protein